MDEFIGVAFQPVARGVAVFLFGRTAEHALAVLPHMLRIFIADVALHILKAADRILAVGVLGAVDAAPSQQTGQLGDGNAVELLVEDMVHPLLQIGDLVLQPHQQPLGDLSQKHAGLTRRV